MYEGMVFGEVQAVWCYWAPLVMASDRACRVRESRSLSSPSLSLGLV